MSFSSRYTNLKVDRVQAGFPPGKRKGTRKGSGTRMALKALNKLLPRRTDHGN